MDEKTTTQNYARDVMEAEANAIRLAAERLGPDFEDALTILEETKGKVIVTGLGKSGHVGRKMAATFCSTGTRAVFLHSVEAVHGDVGIYAPGDPTILISKSGTTAELLQLIPAMRRQQSQIIGILGNPNSPLSREVDFTLDASVSIEADPLGIVPTASFVVTAALGDALASSLMRRRGFTEEDYALVHPAGQLGRNLILTVADTMHKMGEVATCAPDTTLKDLVIAMSEKPLGAACVMEGGRLIGIVTDGDLRRALEKNEDVRSLRALALMTPDPVTISPENKIGQAVRLMEERESQIAVLPVQSSDGSLVGLLRLHDVYQPSGA
ncbi:MAG: KpsF/GutQ family sugar-phosphate isomerase [Opitutales bacterium]|jgi:arabinose-5-phosphate isomerase